MIINLNFIIVNIANEFVKSYKIIYNSMDTITYY